MMLPSFIQGFFAEYQDLLWVTVVILDLGLTLLLYRFFGKAGLYAIVVLNIMLSNIQGPKLTEIFGMTTSLGMILYAGIYFATDLLSEKYGRREGTRAVMIGFATSAIVVLMMSINLLFIPVTEPELSQKAHNALTVLFDFTPLFVFGSLFVYLISQNLDVWIFHFLKHKTKGKHLWLRNNVSTILSQAVDTVLYAVIVWMPFVGFSTAIKLALAKYVFKVIVAAIDTPFIYWARSWDASNKDWNETAQHPEWEDAPSSKPPVQATADTGSSETPANEADIKQHSTANS
ncbi:MAG: queuosine precursor transporter [Pseudomonadota bacterium]